MISVPSAANLFPGWVSAPLNSKDMRHTNLWAVYVAGYCIHALTDSIRYAKNSLEAWSIIYHGKRGVEILLTDDPFQLSQHTLALLEELNSDLETCLNLRRELLGAYREAGQHKDEPDWNDAFTRIFNLTELSKDLETALAHELPQLSVFFIPQKGTHRTDHLMESAVTNLSPDVKAFR
jgi:hypothetical protein